MGLQQHVQHIQHILQLDARDGLPIKVTLMRYDLMQKLKRNQSIMKIANYEMEIFVLKRRKSLHLQNLPVQQPHLLF